MNESLWDGDSWIMFLTVLLFWILAAGSVWKIVFVLVRKWSARTKNTIDDLVIDSLALPSKLLLWAAGILVSMHWLPREQAPDLVSWLLVVCKILGLVSVVLFVDKFLRGLISHASARVEILHTSGPVVQGFVRVVVVVMGGLVLLDTFGVSITPLIASLGIGSLAVALALQPTLENFFSGVQLIADKPIQIGQFVKLESGEEGTVACIGWRSTWITMSNNNTVVIPNKTLVNTRVTNYFYPSQELVVLVGIGVHYASDLDKVEQVTVAVARKIMKESSGGVPSFDPFIRYHTFGEYSIGLNVIMRAKDWPSSHLVKHDFIKEVLKVYAAEGIIIPFPTRTFVKESQEG